MLHPQTRLSFRKLAWRHSSKATLFLVLSGLITFAGCLSWWLQDQRLSSPWLLLTFLIFAIYGGVQLIGSWLLYLAACQRRRYPV